MNLVYTQIKNILKNAISVSESRAAAFFKTGIGEYAQGDRFIGVSVPNIRKIAKEYSGLQDSVLECLLKSKINEERLLALIILVNQYKKADESTKERTYQFYIKNLQYVNNWNLVDASAHLIIGAHLFNKKRQILIDLAHSAILWDRRIAMVSTWYFIRQNDVAWTFKIAILLQNDKEDLIHKAVGWMLREAGKRDEPALILFLDQYAGLMPRTMLRYAIEKFPQETRQQYLLNKK